MDYFSMFVMILGIQKCCYRNRNIIPEENLEIDIGSLQEQDSSINKVYKILLHIEIYFAFQKFGFSHIKEWKRVSKGNTR